MRFVLLSICCCWRAAICKRCCVRIKSCVSACWCAKVSNSARCSLSKQVDTERPCCWCWQVQTPDGRSHRIELSFCINCAGAAAGHVAKLAGIGTNENPYVVVPVPVEPRSVDSLHQPGTHSNRFWWRWVGEFMTFHVEKIRFLWNYNVCGFWCQEYLACPVRLYKQLDPS